MKTFFAGVGLLTTLVLVIAFLSWLMWTLGGPHYSKTGQESPPNARVPGGNSSNIPPAPKGRQD